MTWHGDQLSRIADSEELQITTRRPDGTQRRWTPICVVRVGDALYIRSAGGRGSDWYRHATQHLAPRGPLTCHDVPAPDEVRLKPAAGWLLAGIPKMQAGIRDSLAKPVTLALTGPGGGAWLLDPDTELITVTATDPENAAAARIESTTHAFTAWASTRLPWRDHVSVTGDESIAAKFLDALNLV